VAYDEYPSTNNHELNFGIGLEPKIGDVNC